jgi:hypothetical protein
LKPRGGSDLPRGFVLAMWQRAALNCALNAHSRLGQNTERRAGSREFATPNDLQGGPPARKSCRSERTLVLDRNNGRAESLGVVLNK